jgi:putative acetyltransferase
LRSVSQTGYQNAHDDAREHTMTLVIRPERPEDADAIHDLTVRAFAPMPFSSGTEAPIIRALRKAGDLTLSLVAEVDGGIAGHVAFSPVTVEGDHAGWFGLGPVSVAPEKQRQGIGRALIEKGLEILKQRDAAGCALIGNPAIYGRMGFESDEALKYGTLDVKLVQRVVFRGTAPRGELKFAPAFDTDGHAS